jgi:WD40 repeat protein
MIWQIHLGKFAPWLGHLSQPRYDCGEELLVLQGLSWAHAVAFLPDGFLIASASINGTVNLWNVNTGATYGCLKGHSQGVRSVAFSPNGLQVASAADNTTVRLWNVITGVSNFVLEGHSYSVEYVAFSPNGFLLASA